MKISNKQKIKIVFILPSLTAGGAERVLITLMNNIDSELFDPAFITLCDKGELKKIIDADIPFYSLHKKHVPLALPKLYSTLKELKPDIVMTTMAHMNFTLLLIKFLFPKTHFVVREAITPSFILDKYRFFSFALKAAYRLLYSQATLVISPSQTIINEFKDILGMSCENHLLLYNPVDLDRIREGEDENYEISEDRKNKVHFVAAGRLHIQKGFDQLIEALPKMKQPYDWQLTILGEGSERQSLEALIKEKGLEDKIHLAGLKERPWPDYAKADCFVMPSRWEGLPNVVLESLACGTPVIATRQSGGIEEIQKLSPPGSITIANNMSEFIKAMEKIHPIASEKFRLSLLPASFKKENIINDFEDALCGAVKIKEVKER
ncbi:MAG: glycosyltransferase [Alphaproteobacteria bacterium]|nr:glycosyltransferase [Alphaproteobacteria bacterium]